MSAMHGVGFLIKNEFEYKPDHSCSYRTFLDEVLTLFQFLSSISDTFLICGDFNIHVDVSSRTVPI